MVTDPPFASWKIKRESEMLYIIKSAFKEQSKISTQLTLEFNCFHTICIKFKSNTNPTYVSHQKKPKHKTKIKLLDFVNVGFTFISIPSTKQNILQNTNFNTPKKPKQNENKNTHFQKLEKK